MSTEKANADLRWSRALDAMEAGHNVASPRMKKLGYHLRARFKNLAVIDLVQTTTGDVVVDGYIPTTGDRLAKWEIIR